MSVLKEYQESFVADLGVKELKSVIDEKEKKFFVYWISDKEFKISLNFSVGTNHSFDINNETKSAIVAFGTLSELSSGKTQINLKAKFKYGLILILFIPIIMLILEFTMNLGIPKPFYFVFPFFFILTLLFFRSEEKKLIGYFKNQIGT